MAYAATINPQRAKIQVVEREVSAAQRSRCAKVKHMPATAIILFAHGARDPEWAAPLRRVCAALGAQTPGLRVELAFLELQSPSLLQAAESLLADGFGRIVVVPMFIAQGGHVKNDLPHLIDELRERNPEVRFELAGAVGEAEGVVQAMAAEVLALAAGDDGAPVDSRPLR